METRDKGVKTDNEEWKTVDARLYAPWEGKRSFKSTCCHMGPFLPDLLIFSKYNDKNLYFYVKSPKF